MRSIALDVHRSFAQTAILENGKLRDAGKIDLEYSRVLRFARKLKPDDEIVIEATGNTSAIVRVLLPFVGRVVIANPILVRAIAWAKAKPRISRGGLSARLDLAARVASPAVRRDGNLWASIENRNYLAMRFRKGLVKHIRQIFDPTDFDASCSAL